MRLLYECLLSLHPPYFRERFGEEMLWIYDRARDPAARAALLWDCGVSLARQWVLRSEYWERPPAEPVADGVPVFASFDEPPPRASALVNGALVSMAVFGVVAWGFNHSRSFPVSGWFGGGEGMAQSRASKWPNPGNAPAQSANESAMSLWIGSSRDKLRTDVAQALVERFDSHSLVALAERHGTRQDSELRLSVIRHPRFRDKARTVVMECGNSLHQPILDRYTQGGDVPRTELQRVWRDVLSPGGCDSPVYGQLIDEVRTLNQNAAPESRIRVLAAGPPIDWQKVRTREEVARLVAGSEKFAASLIQEEVLRRGRNALVVFGAGHLWRNTAGEVIPDDYTLVSLIDIESPGQLFTVVRAGGSTAEIRNLEKFLGTRQRPVLFPLQGTVFAMLDPNQLLDLPFRLFPTGVLMGYVADACVYTGSEADVLIEPHASVAADQAYQAEKQRRKELRRRPTEAARPASN